MSERHNCKNCGRFYRPEHDYDEACSYACRSDLAAERKKWDDMKRSNEQALIEMSRHDDCDCLSCRPWTY